MVSIYDYNDPVEFLNDYFNAITSLNQSFTLKGFAHKIGLNSAGPIIDILRRKKRISSKLSSLLANHTNIDPSERMYFEALISRSHSVSDEKTRMYDLILNELRPVNKNQNPVFRTSKLNLFSHWIYMAIFAMSDLKDFELSAQNIKKKLREQLDESIIEKALFQLFEHKILIKDINGNISSPYFRVTTHTDKYHGNTRTYFKMVCDLAKDAYDISIDQREFQSFSFAIAQEDIPLAKEIIRKCRSSLGNLSKNEKVAHIYQANLMLFPLSKIEENEQISGSTQRAN